MPLRISWCGFIGLAVAVLCNFASPVCAEPAKYVFWDSYHPTERGYQILVDAIVAGNGEARRKRRRSSIPSSRPRPI